MKSKVVIIDSDANFIEEMKECVKQKANLELCGCATNGAHGIELIERLKPDVAVFNIILKELDGLELLDRIKRNNIACKSLVLGNFVDDGTISNCISRGASYYVAKPVKAAIVVSRILEIVEASAKAKRGGSDALDAEYRVKRAPVSVEEKVSNIFMAIGIPPHIKGYAFLREGIRLAVENPSIINNVTKELYPKIAEKFSSSASKVERAVRHGIEVAWNRGRIDVFNSILGVRVYMGNERPTNSEFIALIADKLLFDSITV